MSMVTPVMARGTMVMKTKTMPESGDDLHLRIK
jgi:hypothetical protein